MIISSILAKRISFNINIFSKHCDYLFIYKLFRATKLGCEKACNEKKINQINQ
jgi:hypothetical protein